MTAYVFLGPSLPLHDARRHLADAVYLPPVAQGDIIRVAERRPSMIGIIDGAFERVPTVWHKEILWALDEGIPVLGASSMGALRAAELDTFGMEGVGWVYEAFRSGELEDDDEVAVVHAPADEGYRPLSDAMVNIRRTLQAAVADGLLSHRTGAVLLTAAKGRFYADRHLRTVLQDAEVAGVGSHRLTALQRFLDVSAVDQKRDDAVALLQRMSTRLLRGETSVRTTFTFEKTVAWRDAQHDAGRLRLEPTVVGADAAPGGPDRPAVVATTLTTELLLDELRLDGVVYARIRDAAEARLHALEAADARGGEVDAALLEATSATFRGERGLEHPDDARRWLEANDLSDRQVERLLREEARIGWGRPDRKRSVAGAVPDQLRLSGCYPELAARALDKHRRLEEAGLADVSLEDLGISWDDLVAWYVRERLGAVTPPDLVAFANAQDYRDEVHLLRVLLRDYVYELVLAREGSEGERCEPSL